jgi:Fe-S oxidoreductase
MSKIIRPADLLKSSSDQLVELKQEELMPLPHPYDKPDMEPEFMPVKDSWREKYCTSLDGFVGIDTLVRPADKAEEEKMVKAFLEGMQKLLSLDTNKNWLQPLTLSLDYCAKCNTCSEACPVFVSSGRNELYRPIFRSEVFRSLVKRYCTTQGKLLGPLVGADVELSWEGMARLGELAYRCTLCRRCAKACPLALDNGLIAREIRKLFSMELGIAPTPLHAKGTMLQLKTGSSTGITKPALLDILEFIEEDIEERTGKKIKFPLDKKGADILLIHNAGEFTSWPENPAAFAILFEEAGLNWTLSTDLIGYDSVNYGVWYDDVMARRIAEAQFKAAKDLGVRRMVIGECGHAHRAALVSTDRLITSENYVPRESCFPLLWDLVKNSNLKFDPSKNNFPVTLHDPCNIVRAMGIVQPQRNILKAIAPGFREMTPHGVDNYCCGGGSGFAIMNSMNFLDFRNKISSRMKFKQILDAFQEEIDNPDIVKVVCAPCSNCKGAMRDLFEYYDATNKFNLQYTGLVELMVNALTDLDRPYLEFLEH